MTRPIDSHIAARSRTVEAHLQAENLHDLGGIMQTFGAGARYDDEPWGEHHLGRERVRAYYEQLFRAVPDLAIDVERWHVTDNAVILEVVVRGTHLGPWRGLPGTGRRLAFPLCAVYTFDDTHRLAGEKIYYDRATVLSQIGLFREPGSLAGRIVAALAHPMTLARALARSVRRR